MLLSNLKRMFNKREIETSIIQFMVKSEHLSDRPYAYCCGVKRLLDDWHGDCNFVPENDAMLLMVTLYRHGNVWPITQIGLDESVTFETLMMALDFNH